MADRNVKARVSWNGDTIGEQELYRSRGGTLRIKQSVADPNGGNNWDKSVESLVKEVPYDDLDELLKKGIKETSGKEKELLQELKSKCQ